MFIIVAMGISIALIAVLFIFATVVRFSRRLLYDDFSAELNRADFSARIARLAEEIRLPDRRGAGVDATALKSVIGKAFNIIKNKVRRGETLFEYEKWLYDNNYLVKRYMNDRCYDTFYRLPHSGGVPRILVIARRLISYTGGNLTVEKLCAALSEINAVSPLTVRENFCFKDAVAYAALEKIAAVSRKCVYYRRLFKAAVKAKDVVKKYAKSNIYIYYVIKSNPKLANRLKSYLKIEGESYDNVDYTFSSLIIENNVLTGNLIKTLQSADKYSDCIWSSLRVNTVLEGDEIYRDMDAATKRHYLGEIGRQSDKLNVDEITFARALLDLQPLMSKHIGQLLFDYKRAVRAYIEKRVTINLSKRRDNKEVVYSSTLFFTAFALSAVPSVLAAKAFFNGFNIYAFLAALLFTICGFIALLPAAGHLTDTLFKLFIPVRVLAKMDYKELPDNAKTLLTVPVFVTSAEEISDNIRHLREIKAVNSDKNIEFALLLDFKAADYESAEEDKPLFDEIENLLKGRKDITVLVRKREYQNGKFCGYERKRGAIEALNRYLVEKKGNIFKIFGKVLSKPQFIMILDADNTVAPEGIKKAVNTFLHPFNAEYDLLTLEGRVNLFSLKTAFSKKHLCGGGLEFYPSYSNFYYNLSGMSLFAGKGIYRLQSFYDKLCGKLPENKILSHDVLEGGLLKTGISGETTYEDAPLNFVSEAVRNARWQRGDVQLLPFLSKKRLCGCPKMTALCKTVIFKNAFSVLSPFFILAFLTAALFTSDLYLLLIGGAALFLGFAVSFTGFLLSAFSDKRLIYTLKDLALTILNLIYSLFTLPYAAVNGAHVFLTTLARMAQKGNLLQWKTFISCQKSGRFTELLKLVAFPLTVLTALCALSLFTAYSLYVLIYTGLFCVFFIIIHFCGHKKEQGDRTDEKLLEYAEKTYAYFTAFQKNGLIADHFNHQPKGEAANYTSPTNIGFCMLAHAAAAELGIISGGEAEERISAAVEGIEKLKKWKGHLYNWYNIETLEPLEPQFVSSVDSGNLVACLTAVKAICGENLKKRIEKLINNVNFSALFDYGKQMFYIGYSPRQNIFSGHYDLMASEARLLSYVSVAMGVSSLNWQTLSRELNGKRGNTLSSWNGTMFEYLMPQLFLPETDGSMLKRTAANAAKVQASTPCNGFFGISESGYYAFDDRSNYQYEAFGVDSLGLKSSINKCVVSPYSSFLALTYIPARVKNNLEKLEKAGLLGEYGFYEALDCTDGEKKVCEYMAHHQGMSLASIANYLKPDCVKKLFFADEAMAGAAAVLTERQPEKRAKRKSKNKFLYKTEGEENYVARYGGMLLKPQFNLMRGGKYYVALDDYGQGYSVFDGFFINRFNKDIKAASGAFFYVTDLTEGETRSPTFAPLAKQGDYAVSFKKDCSVYDNGNLKLEVECPEFFDGEIRRLTVFNPEKTVKRYKVAYYGELSLSTADSDGSHRAFNDLFIKTSAEEINSSTSVIKAARRFLDKDSHLYLTALVKGVVGFNAVTNRFNFIGRNRTAKNPVILEEDFSPRINDNGDVLAPCVGFIGELVVGAESYGRIDVITSVSTEEEKGERLMKKALSPHFGEFVKDIPFVVENTSKELSAAATEFMRKMFGRLLYLPLEREKLLYIKENRAGAARVTDGFKYKNIYYKFSLGREEELSELVLIVGIFKKLCLKVRLIIGYEEKDYYFEEVKRAASSAVKTGVIGEEILLAELNKEGGEELYINTAFHIFDGFVLNEKNGKGGLVTAEKVQKMPVPQFDFVTGEGGYAGGFYVVVPKDEATGLPYSDVICLEEGGTVVSESGGGYTYFGNSRENKVTVWGNDPVSNGVSERLFLIKDGKFWTLNRCGGTRVYGKGIAVWEGQADGLQIQIKQFLIKNGRIKVYEAEINNLGRDADISLILSLDLVLGWQKEDGYILITEEGGLLRAENLKNGQSVYLKADGEADFVMNAGELYSRSSGEAYNPSKEDCGLGYGAVIKEKIGELSKKTLYFAFSNDKDELSDFDEESVKEDKIASLRYFNNLNPFKIYTSDKSLDVLFNDCLMYQTVSSRINGKTAFYQAGGATGFRDVLQDCLALMYSDGARVKRIILDCAAHQYEEGDVQHWWHPPRWGVRTRISDDKLFLPYVVFEYIKITGDKDILDEKVPYLSSKRLAKTESSRYECPALTEKAESLRRHIGRAFDSAYRLGKNGLLLIGGGDWNDALDGVGDENSGESVWLTMFMYGALTAAAPYFSDKDKLKYVLWAEELKRAVDNCYCGHYKRLITDKGEWLGDGGSTAIGLDLITQAWSAISGIAEEEKVNSALKKAEELIDYENGLIKLLWPPATEEKYYGYISKYPLGVRENGGQYTHGAVWYIQALLKQGFTDRAYELLRMINPVEKGTDAARVKAYKGEPYVLAADVYTNPANAGRAGWTWYTGSASWCFKCILEDLLGIRLVNGVLCVKPERLPAALDGVRVEYRAGGDLIDIEISRSDEEGFYLDGVKCDNGNLVPQGGGIRKVKVNVEGRF